jgi:hypothetical protein
MHLPTRFRVRFFFEWGGGWLWCGNDATREFYGVGPIEGKLPISAEILERGDTLSAWHDTSLNWEYPPDPGTWTQEECDQFNTAVADFLVELRRELEPSFEIQDEQGEVRLRL